MRVYFLSLLIMLYWSPTWAAKGTVLLHMSIVQTPGHEWEERKVWITSGYKALVIWGRKKPRETLSDEQQHQKVGGAHVLLDLCRELPLMWMAVWEQNKMHGKRKEPERGNCLANTYKINLNAHPTVINPRLDLKFTDCLRESFYWLLWTFRSDTRKDAHFIRESNILLWVKNYAFL